MTLKWIWLSNLRIWPGNPIIFNDYQRSFCNDALIGRTFIFQGIVWTVISIYICYIGVYIRGGGGGDMPSNSQSPHKQCITPCFPSSHFGTSACSPDSTFGTSRVPMHSELNHILFCTCEHNIGIVWTLVYEFQESSSSVNQVTFLPFHCWVFI